VQRNRDAILMILQRIFEGGSTKDAPHIRRVLEIASGTGEHAAHFAAALPSILWQPSDPDATALASIAAWREHAQAAGGISNLAAPIVLDVRAMPWPDTLHADAVVCINMIHIAPWEAAQALFTGAEKLLPAIGLLYLYGPYRRDGVPTAPSNEAFDAQLRASDPRWGLRNLSDVVQLALQHRFALSETIEMPANNLSLIFHSVSALRE
jgi:SAM-dependent methyltransferase